MQTTAATDRAARRSSLLVQPMARKIRHVNNSVATVIPEIGLEEEPISPVNLEETVTNKKPKSTINAAPSGLISNCGIHENVLCNGVVAQIAPTKATDPIRTVDSGRSRSVRR